MMLSAPIGLSKDTVVLLPVITSFSTLLNPAAIVFAEVGPVFRGSKLLVIARVSVPSPPS